MKINEVNTSLSIGRISDSTQPENPSYCIEFRNTDVIISSVLTAQQFAAALTGKVECDIKLTIKKRGEDVARFKGKDKRETAQADSKGRKSVKRT